MSIFMNFMNSLLKTVLLARFLLFTFLSFAWADDLAPHYKFSGVKATDSPYRNAWLAFQTDLFSGSFSCEYRIAVPPVL
jgi:hypothetical protein